MTSHNLAAHAALTVSSRREDYPDPGPSEGPSAASSRPLGLLHRGRPHAFHPPKFPSWTPDTRPCPASHNPHCPQQGSLSGLRIMARPARGQVEYHHPRDSHHRRAGARPRQEPCPLPRLDTRKPPHQSPRASSQPQRAYAHFLYPPTHPRPTSANPERSRTRRRTGHNRQQPNSARREPKEPVRARRRPASRVHSPRHPGKSRLFH